MSFLFYLGIYLACCLLGTYLLSGTFGLNKSLPDRRKSDRRKTPRLGSVDRRASYREDAKQYSMYTDNAEV